jgi:hypothetical protein
MKILLDECIPKETQVEPAGRLDATNAVDLAFGRQSCGSEEDWHQGGTQRASTAALRR